MKTRRILMAVVVTAVFCTNFQVVSADDPDEKVDLILQEIRRLSARVGRLEAELKELKRSQQTKPAKAMPSGQLIQHPFRPYRSKAISPMLPAVQPKDVMKMQQDSPNELMRNIHERERQLRTRSFPADSVPIWPR